MLKMIKTTALASLVALSFTAALGTTAHAESFNQSQAQQARNAQFQNDRNNNDELLGGVVGAVVGGVIGSEVAGRGSRTEGAVLGALLGGLTGATIAGNSGKSKSNFNRNFSSSRPFSSQYSQNRYSYNRGYNRNNFSSTRRGIGFNNRGSSNFGNSGFDREIVSRHKKPSLIF